MFQALRQLLRDGANAVSFLTVFPIRYRGGPAGGMFALFPAVGLLIGTLLALVGAVRPLLPGESARFVLILVWVGLSGGLHLDGFADSCDGLLAAAPPERRQAILKDPRLGTWGTAGLALMLLGKYSLLGAAPLWVLLAAPVMGRWAMSLAALLPALDNPGLAASMREGFRPAHTLLASLLALAVLAGMAAASGRWAMLALAMMPPLIVLLAGRWAAQRLGGGLTGDIYGALCELTELVCLFFGTLL